MKDPPHSLECASNVLRNSLTSSGLKSRLDLNIVLSWDLSFMITPEIYFKMPVKYTKELDIFKAGMFSIETKTCTISEHDLRINIDLARSFKLEDQCTNCDCKTPCSGIKYPDFIPSKDRNAILDANDFFNRQESQKIRCDDLNFSNIRSYLEPLEKINLGKPKLLYYKFHYEQHMIAKILKETFLEFCSFDFYTKFCFYKWQFEFYRFNQIFLPESKIPLAICLDYQLILKHRTFLEQNFLSLIEDVSLFKIYYLRLKIFPSTRMIITRCLIEIIKNQFQEPLKSKSGWENLIALNVVYSKSLTLVKRYSDRTFVTLVDKMFASIINGNSSYSKLLNELIENFQSAPNTQSIRHNFKIVKFVVRNTLKFLKNKNEFFEELIRLMQIRILKTRNSEIEESFYRSIIKSESQLIFQKKMERMFRDHKTTITLEYDGMNFYKESELPKNSNPVLFLTTILTSGIWDLENIRMTLPRNLQLIKEKLRSSLETILKKADVKILNKESMVLISINSNSRVLLNLIQYSILIFIIDWKSSFYELQKETKLPEDALKYNLCVLMVSGLVTNENPDIFRFNSNYNTEYQELPICYNLDILKEIPNIYDVQNIVNCEICKILKNVKIYPKVSLLRALNEKIKASEDIINEQLSTLESKGYISIENEILKYNP